MNVTEEHMQEARDYRDAVEQSCSDYLRGEGDYAGMDEDERREAFEASILAADGVWRGPSLDFVVLVRVEVIVTYGGPSCRIRLTDDFNGDFRYQGGLGSPLVVLPLLPAMREAYGPVFDWIDA